MKFTIHQDRAIHSDHENILVNAGAGSGKTAVLTERVLRKLTEGIHIDSLIILTFTNAAAAEMKSRIKDKILETPSLVDELKHLDNAVISTFDSFALRIVKEYYYLLDLPEDVRIVDPVVLYKHKEKIMDETLAEFYKENNSTFLKTVDRLFDRGDDTFKEGVLVLAKGIEAIPNPLAFLESFESTYYSDSQIQTVKETFSALLKNNVSEIHNAYSLFSDAVGSCPIEKVQLFLESVKNSYETLFNENDPNKLFVCLQSFSHPTLPRLSKEDQEVWGETLKSSNDALKKVTYRFQKELRALFSQDLSEAQNAFLEPKETVLSIVEVTKTYLKKLALFKRQNNLFEFGDIMNLCIQLFEQFHEIRDEYTDKIHEILVDEYQDTNDLQDYLLSLLEKNNVFMVGDVKQSIYGFRNANPRNFMQKYRDFDEKHTGKTIDLLENFRSRKEVLSSINDFFQSIMTKSMGGVDYQNRQALVFGNELYTTYQPKNQSYSPEILIYHDEEEIEGAPKVEKIPNAIREARIIANDIRKKLTDGYRVYDLKAKTDRLVSFSDFAILIDRKSDFDAYEKTLVDAGLPVFAIADEPFLASSEILFVNNALQLLKCFSDQEFFTQKFKQVFYGVGRSFVYEIPDEDLVQAMATEQYRSIRDLPKMETDPSFSTLYRDFSSLATLSDTLPMDDLLLRIYRKLDLFTKIASLPNPGNIEKKLLFLLEKTKELPDFSLDELIDYFDLLYRSGELDVEFSKPYDPSINAIRLMTIHKSKGLEFPICYYPGLYKRFNLMDNQSFFIFDRTYGLITKAWDEGFKPTILHLLYKQKNVREYISERIRLFYVALTRAKEKMIFLLNTTKEPDIEYQWDESGYVDESIRMRYRSYSDVVFSVPLTRKWYHEVSDEATKTLKTATEPFKSVKPISYREMQVAATEPKTQRYSKQTFALRSKEDNEKIELGLKLHKELEQIDYHHLNESFESVSPLVQSAIRKLVATPLFANINQATVHQEYEFYQMTESGTRHGIIDLILEYPDHLDVIDYKLSHLDDEAYRLQLSGYQQFLSVTTHKPVSIHLFSLTTRTLTSLEE